MVRLWGRQRGACRNPTWVSNTEQGLTNRFPYESAKNKQAYNLTRGPDNKLGMVEWAYSKRSAECIQKIYI